MTRRSLGADSLRADPARLDPVLTGLRESVDQGIVPVGALAVGDADGPIRSVAFGPRGTDVEGDSFFFLASVTKPIVACAFMQLVESGLTGLREPFASHIPELAAGDKAAITPWHVLTHTSGLTDVEIEDIRQKRPSAAQMTRMAIEAPLRFVPGTRWEYCSASFYLLALLIERLTGTALADYLHDRLFEPLGMHATFDPRGKGRPIVPVAGVDADNPFIRWLLLRYMARVQVPGGGLFATLDDLLAFGAAILRPRQSARGWLPLSPATIDEMGTDQTAGLRGDVDGVEREIHFGLGWSKPTLMRDAPGSARVVAHGGASGTRLRIDPDVGLVFVYFTSAWAADRKPEMEALAGVYRALSA
jgi:CubicO group peptidase (beta-lactamase class C family)